MTAKEDPPACVVRRSSYGGAAYENIIALCEDEFRDPQGLHTVSYFDHGFHGFSADLFHKMPGRFGERDAETVREGYENAFHEFVINVERMDRLLADLETGDLIRTVVETSDGGIHCDWVYSGEYIVGATLDTTAVESMDRKMSALATRIRKLAFNQPGRMPGGDIEAEAAGLAEPVTPHLARGELLGEAAARGLREVCVPRLTAGDLHYVALHVDWEFRFSADVFDNPALDSWFHRLTRDLRRKQYLEVARRLQRDLAELTHALWRFTHEPFRRVVLDVESGAIFVYPLNRSGAFLLGVTLFQPLVPHAEDRMRELLPDVERVLDETPP
ncbi:hypothetical protein C1I98_17595 [Spongiactinospora gelatinilytica]|uniref:Uncharacterized protein n=1 Tax=Spongiactinospora gelatinilytica TaxID=2666298 RepID=A0A2W2H3J1_9ACTN|nr:hypothetical protein [Spongiactinospora gelatinilytica]PZG44148.1 hypothetical protein C1I98_17595 [Spongiactinospora gelatinilytica]